MLPRLPTDAQPLLELLLTRARATHTDALALHWRGQRQVWRFGRHHEPIQSMSVTKSIVGLVIGRLVTLGYLNSIDEPVHSFFAEWRQGHKREITIRMLMEHTSGLQNVAITTEEIYPSQDFVQLALCAELESAPGERYAYNNKAVNLLAGVVERAVGRKLDDFARAELLEPPSITEHAWLRDPAGNPHAMSGLALHAGDLLALGELVLNRGVWQGDRLIDESWFEAMDATPEGEENALLWWHVNEVRIKLTPSHLEALEGMGASSEVTGKLKPLLGSHTSTYRFFSALQLALGVNWRALIPNGVQPFSMQFGSRIGYRAEGDLGQHVYVFPQERLVAVRQISEATIAREEPSSLEPPDNKDDHVRRVERFIFSDFEQRLLALRDALPTY